MTKEEQEFCDKLFLSILPAMLQNESRWTRCDTDDIIDTAWGIADKALKQRSCLNVDAPEGLDTEEYEMEMPQGWPTNEMMIAGAQAIQLNTTDLKKLEMAGAVFTAMIEAAETPPATDPTVDHEAMESAWASLSPQLDSENWTEIEWTHFKGFFAWGCEARRKHAEEPTHEIELIREKKTPQI